MSEELARKFHETYEQLAPQFGYATREDTKQFDASSPNGKLMIAVCAVIAGNLERDEARAEVAKLRQDAQREAEHHDRMVGELERLYDKNDKLRDIAEAHTHTISDVASSLQEFEARQSDLRLQGFASALQVKSMMSQIEELTNLLRNVERERDEARVDIAILKQDAQREAEHHDRMVRGLYDQNAKLREIAEWFVNLWNESGGDEGWDYPVDRKTRLLLAQFKQLKEGAK